MELGIRSRCLPRFRILQIGDVHYPEWVPNPATTDLKTDELGTAIISNLQSDKFQNLLRFISREDFLQTCDSVIFMGDFTTKGDVTAQLNAITHLSHLMRINPNAPGQKFHAVPGNHDVNREIAIAQGMLGKFTQLSDHLTTHGFSTIPRIHPTCLKIGDQQRPVQLLLANTTLGSWEKVGIPPRVREWIEGLSPPVPLTTAAATGIPINPVPLLDPDQYYDQMDTPFVSKFTIQEIKSAIDDDPEQCLPCIVGHHNILPQSTPRIAPFGELLNQGEFRNSLLSVGRPALYLHGHIHTDPIEIISSATFPGSQLISVSAPLLMDGVNLIDVFFNSAGEPIGLSIIGLRPDPSGHIRAASTYHVALKGAAAGLIRNPAGEAVYRQLASGRRSWADLVRAIVSDDVSEDDLEAVTLELMWASLIKIVNDTVPRQRWVMELSK